MLSGPRRIVGVDGVGLAVGVGAAVAVGVGDPGSVGAVGVNVGRSDSVAVAVGRASVVREHETRTAKPTARIAGRLRLVPMAPPGCLGRYGAEVKRVVHRARILSRQARSAEYGPTLREFADGSPGGVVDSARDLPAVLDTAGAAELLGVNIDKMRQMARDGQVPAHLLPGGRMYRFLTDELLTWLRDQPGAVRGQVEAADG